MRRKLTSSSGQDEALCEQGLKLTEPLLLMALICMRPVCSSSTCMHVLQLSLLLQTAATYQQVVCIFSGETSLSHWRLSLAGLTLLTFDLSCAPLLAIPQKFSDGQTS